MRSLSVPGAVLAAGALVTTAALAAPAAAGVNTPAAVSVVIDHLNNPRGLALAPDGTLLLAEAGNGGSFCLDAQHCAGNSGSFDKISGVGAGQTASRTKLLSGLFSIASQNGAGAEGPVAITTGDGTFGVFGANTYGIPPNAPPSPVISSAKTQLGQLVSIAGTHMTAAAPYGGSVGDQDYRWAGAHKSLVPQQFPDSNPNGVLVTHGHVYVADAGSNTLDEIVNGVSHQIAFFPAPAGAPADSVPTCVAQGPDGALYVGELLGGFYAPGHARIWRVVPGQAPTVWAGGLTTVQGCGFTPDGAFYAVEFQAAGFSGEGPGGNPQGDVVQIINGRLTHLAQGGALFFPSGFAPAPGHGIFVSNCSIAPAGGMGQLCPNGGEVVRIG